ncbi:hypothetical protein [Uliginosibacterium sp. H1]|uniref:hypothetical protein n=1 Tax=Uliginosibacterium sp. H1 TaxID=3114757 RepID=UPI002E175B77|nr:hypothetical protein [Uliginosibacterium sp. H1]
MTRRWAASGLLALLCLPAHAGEVFKLMTPVRYAPDAHVVGAARTSCDLEGYASRVFGERIRTSYPGSTELSDAVGFSSVDGKVLRVSIVNVYGVGGGGWSGTKSVTIRADLLEKGRLIGIRSITRSSRSLLGAVSGTCPMLENCLDALSKDVMVWLSHPPAPPPDTTPEQSDQSAPSAG